MPGRWEFDDIDDLVSYVAGALGADVDTGGGGSGRVSRKGTYTRRRADGTRALTFGDPILDLITSPVGEIVIGGRSIDMTRFAAGANTQATQGPGIARALEYTGEESGFERWAEPDGSKVEYRAGFEALIFETFKDERFLFRKLGVRIRTRGTPFERAAIDSKYLYPSYAGLCTVDFDSDHDSNDDELEESSTGWGPPGSVFPTRVLSLCRAQWKSERFSDIVSRGSACEIIGGADSPFPTDFPADWPPYTGMAVSPRLLTITSKGGATAEGTITVTNRDPGSYSLTVFDAVGPFFSNPAGIFPLPANGGRHQVVVKFVGHHAATSSVRIDVDDGRSFTVPVTGTVNLGGGQPL